MRVNNIKLVRLFVHSHEGYVAITVQGQMIGRICILLSSNFKQCFNKLGLRDTMPLFDSFYLSFPDHIHRFDSTQCSSFTVEQLESHHRFHRALEDNLGQKVPSLVACFPQGTEKY